MNTSLTLKTNLPSIYSIEAYKSYVKSLPSLSEKEEIELFKKFKEQNCLESVQKIILAHLKNVLWISDKYKTYGIPEEDIIQEGNIGLMKAIKNYDLIFNVKLVTYAVIWIKSEIQSYVLKNWKIVKIATTNNLKKLFFNFKKLKNEMLQHNLDSRLINESIAKKLEVPIDDVLDMENYFSNSDSSLSDYETEDGESFLPFYNTETPQLILEHKEKIVKEEKILGFIQSLDEREQFIIKNKFLSEDIKTNKEIAQMLSISSERVRQIEEKAIQKMKKMAIE